jgi:hypothetical protein
MISILLSLVLVFSQHKEYSPTVADYDSKIEHVTSMSRGVFSSDTWTGIVMKSKSSQKEKSWDQMSDKDKDVFMFVVGIRTLNSIIKIEEFWNDEIQKFENPTHRLVPSQESRPATKKEVQEYLARLDVIKKKFVKEMEIYNNTFFGKYHDEIPSSEASAFQKRIRVNK